MLNAVKYRLPLHACQSSFEFFYTLLCGAEVFLRAEGSFQRNAASVERLIPGMLDRNLRLLLWFLSHASSVS